MKFTTLGQSGLRIPAIGQGADVGKNISKNFEYSIRYGVDHGMTFIDTAEVYGNGMSEEAIGKAIKGVREQIILATKVLSDNLTYDGVINSAENSLKRLGTECIDLYQIHWPNSNIPIDETMAAFEKLHKDGKIRFVGVSNFLPMEIEASRHTKYSFGGIVSNQMEYSLLNRFAEKYSFPYCKKNNLNMICYCPLARGKLCREQHSSLLINIAAKYAKTPAQIALNWITLQEGAIAIPFSTNLQHIKENAEATDFQLSEEDVELIDLSMTSEIIHCKTSEIKINPKHGIGNFSRVQNAMYQNVEEAVENKFNFHPSPGELALFLSSLSENELKTIKPIKAVRSGDKYELIEGRIRYWGWVIAFGLEKDIPLFIVDGGE